MDKNSVSRFSEKVNRSLFFFGAILMHLVLFLMVVGYVIFPSPPTVKEEPLGVVYVPPAEKTTPPPNPIDSHASTLSGVEVVAPIHTSDASPGVMNSEEFKEKMGVLGDAAQVGHDLSHLPTPAGPPVKSGPRVNMPGVKQTVLSWDGPNGSKRFPIYLAKYSNGDWDCNTYFHGSDLTSGCLPNLLAKVDEWSHGDLKSKEIKVVALDSPELIDNPPPFVFFTGHKDFVLTEAEVANLRKYLQNGGAIWGDSAFSGDGSRFDVAFHREMKRVLPDADLQFEPLSTDHPIFSQSRFHIDDLPKGMNYRADPIECINLGGKLAVIYTPNDYSDMMTMLLLPGRDEHSAQEAPENHWTAQHPLFTPSGFNAHQETFFRNYAASSAMTSYKLSMNILVHLLHRYDDELLMTP